MHSEQTLELAQDSLEDLKARDIRVFDVRELTTVADYLLIASGTSDRHVRSLSEKIIRQFKEAGEPPLGIEGQDAGEWILIDLHDVIVHVMQPRTREFYKLEDLWALGSGPEMEHAGN